MTSSPKTGVKDSAIVLAVVMPAYNEESAIESVVLEHVEILRTLSNELADWEIVCLNDGSRDKTAEILSRLERNERRIRTVHHPHNMGIPASLRDLYAAARGTHIYVTGSDGQWPAHNLARLFKEMRESGADIVVGVRRNRSEVYGVKRLLVSYLFNKLPEILFGAKTGDAGSNKLGRKELLDTKVVSTSPFAEAERILKAGWNGASIRYVDIDFQSRSSGTTTGASVRNIVSSLKDLLACLKTYGFRPRRTTAHRS
jgi:glycosyltransferase involved in cell wall biosynthesis